MQNATMVKGPTKRVSEAVARAKLSEKAARAEKAAQVWNKHPLFAGEFAKFTEAKARQNAAINLTNQARYMKHLNEQETSAEFQRMAPANMMRLVQMTMTNLNRGNVFNEYAMESARDAIYYIKPYFAPSIGDGAGNFAERSMGYGINTDPYGFENHQNGMGTKTVGGYNGYDPAYGGAAVRNGETASNARKAIYESKESRFANELANTETVEVPETGNVTITWGGEDKGSETYFGKKGEKYVPGSTKIYAGHDERKVIAIQDPSTFEYLIAPEYADTIASITDTLRDSNGVKTVITLKTGEGSKTLASLEVSKINAYGRFETEDDYEGKHLGEVNLNTEVYELRPRRTSIGVSWTKLAEITLDSTYNTQIDDALLTAAADVIHSQMDLQAFKDAYSFARTNPSIYTVQFDAGYTAPQVKTEEVKAKTEEGTEATQIIMTAGAKDSYEANAQTFGAAIELVSAALYNDIHRGQINKLVVGVSVAPYLKLMAGFSPKGLQDATGVYKIGELDGVDVFKAPMEVIPDNEVLCVYKNQKVENDVAIVFGTLVPFVSNKLEYPTFYTRAGLASFGDKAVLNKKYLGRIIVNNLKDRIKWEAYEQEVMFKKDI